jgi:hypothetical protein
MAEGRNERYSEYTLRVKPRAEKLAAASANIIKIFNGQAKSTITESAAGDRRVRAQILDEDSGLAYFENTNYGGLAEVRGSQPPRYVAERHYPYWRDLGKPTYFYEFTPETGELQFRYIETDRSDEPPFDMPVEANDEQLGRFLELTRSLLNMWSHNDYERITTPKRYEFMLPELS